MSALRPSRSAAGGAGPPRPTPGRGHSGRRRPGAAYYVALLLVFVLILPPLVSLILGAFRNQPLGQGGGFSLAGVTAVFGGGEFLMPLLRSLELGLLSGVAAVVLGSVLAWTIGQTDVAGRRIWEAILPVPFYMGVLFYAFAAIGLMGGPGYLSPVVGVLGLTPPDVHSLWGSVLVLTITFGSYSFLYLIGPVKSLNSEYLEASLVLGASRIRSLLAIGYRLIAPAMTVNFVIVFGISMEIFSVPQLLWGAKNATLAGAIYNDITYTPVSLNRAAVHALLLLIITGIGVFVYTRMSRNIERYASVSGRSRARQVLTFGRSRWLVAAALGLYFFFTSVLPFAALVVLSLQSFFNPKLDFSTLTLDNYREVFGSAGSGPLVNSAILVVLTSLITVAIAYFVTYIVHFRRSRGTGLLQFSSSASVAIPGLALGVGMLWVYVHAPWGLWGSIWILLIGYVARWLPQGNTLIRSATAAISREQDEAARVLGARLGRRIWQIMLPLTKRSALSALLIVSVVTIHEVPISILLYSPDSKPLSVAVWNSLTGGSLPIGAAYAVLMACASIGLSIVGVLVVGSNRRQPDVKVA